MATSFLYMTVKGDQAADRVFSTASNQ